VFFLSRPFLGGPIMISKVRWDTKFSSGTGGGGLGGMGGRSLFLCCPP